MKKIISVLFFCVCTRTLAFAYYDFDKKLEAAYSAIIRLQFDEAQKLLNEEKTERPGNDLRLLYLNYIDFLKTFISDESAHYDTLKKNSLLRIDQLNKSKDNSASPFHLYVQSEILIQQALVGIKFNENISSAAQIRKAFKLVKKNKSDFPTFVLNKKISGFLDVLVGAVPPRYHWIVNLAGMEGNTTQGIKTLENLYDELGNTQFSCYQPEILFYLGNVQSTFMMTPDSFPLMNLLKQDVGKSSLIAYAYSNILMKQGRNDEALDVLNIALKSYSSYPFTFLYYKRGVARLRKMDLLAMDDFKKFLVEYKGQNNIRSTWQKIAWIALLKGDIAAYKEAIRNCNVKGSTLLDEDKDGRQEAEALVLPNPILLRSRLYFDGGYYEKALEQITGKTLDSFPSHRDQLEVTYRLGRIMQMKKQIDKAIEYYEATIKNGLSSKYYFAANSALMLGQIYEEKKMWGQAMSYYQKCLSIDYDQYKNSIDQKAQAGLERVKASAGNSK